MTVLLLPLSCGVCHMRYSLARSTVRYTNDINPFGDSNLTEQFVWGKKKEKEGTANQQLSKRDLREMQKKNVDEIEKVRFGRVSDKTRYLFGKATFWWCRN